MTPGRIHIGTKLTLLLLGLLTVPGCSGPDVAPPETFDWAEQPIAFSPPGEGWRREVDLSGGRRGVRFVKEGSVGEAIGVAEYYLLGDRDRRTELRELLERFDAFDERDLRNGLSRARWRTDEPLSSGEAQTAEAVNAALDRSMAAFFRGDHRGSRVALSDAVTAAAGLHVTLADVIDRVVFRPEGRSEPGRYRLTGRRDLVVAGEPATRVEYTLASPERVYECREVYVVHDNHLFIANYIGTKANVGLFDAVVASITFPPRENQKS